MGTSVWSPSSGGTAGVPYSGDLAWLMLVRWALGLVALVATHVLAVRFFLSCLVPITLQHGTGGWGSPVTSHGNGNGKDYRPDDALKDRDRDKGHSHSHSSGKHQHPTSSPSLGLLLHEASAPLKELGGGKHLVVVPILLCVYICVGLAVTLGVPLLFRITRLTAPATH
jgi:hypothetical protein